MPFTLLQAPDFGDASDSSSKGDDGSSSDDGNGDLTLQAWPLLLLFGVRPWADGSFRAATAAFHLYACFQHDAHVGEACPTGLLLHEIPFGCVLISCHPFKSSTLSFATS